MEMQFWQIVMIVIGAAAGLLLMAGIAYDRHHSEKHSQTSGQKTFRVRHSDDYWAFNGLNNTFIGIGERSKQYCMVKGQCYT